jgi:hypothetical protein
VRLNVETHGVRLKSHPLWRMRNVLKGRNFHNRRSTTCGSLSIAPSAWKAGLVLSCPALPCPVLPCPALSCPVLSCLVLSCLVLSCLSGRNRSVWSSAGRWPAVMKIKSLWDF